MYEPTFYVSDKMLNYAGEIERKIEIINSRYDLAAVNDLKKDNAIRFVHTAINIDGLRISLAKVRDIISGKTVQCDEKQISRIKACYNAYNEVDLTNPYSIYGLNKIAKAVISDGFDEKHPFRRLEITKSNKNNYVSNVPPAAVVVNFMKSLFSWIYMVSESIHPLILSAVVHYELLYILPYPCFNNSIALLWNNAFARQWSCVFESIPIVRNNKDFKKSYTYALDISNKKGNGNCFIEFLLANTDKVLEDSIKSLEDLQASNSNATHQ